MEKEKFYKIVIGIIILICWIILLSGIINLPAFIWFFLIIVTFIFYIGATNYTLRSRKKTEYVVSDMEDYIERRTAESLGKTDDNNSSDEQDENEYDFGDDIKIIKK